MLKRLARIPGLRVFAASLVAVMLVVGAPGAASAASPSVEYSRDGGTTWSASPPPFLFSSSIRYVPGDVKTENLLIRSIRTEPTLVQISLINAATNNADLELALTVEGADASGAGLSATRFSELKKCDRVVPDRVLSRGQAVSVSLTLRVSSSLAAQLAQNAQGRFDVALALSDPGPTTTPNGCAVDPVLVAGYGTTSSAGSAGLAYTGGTLAYPALIVAAIALGIGWLFVMVGRRRRKHGA